MSVVTHNVVVSKNNFHQIREVTESEVLTVAQLSIMVFGLQHCVVLYVVSDDNQLSSPPVANGVWFK